MPGYLMTFRNLKKRLYKIYIKNEFAYQSS